MAFFSQRNQCVATSCQYLGATVARQISYLLLARTGVHGVRNWIDPGDYTDIPGDVTPRAGFQNFVIKDNPVLIIPNCGFGIGGWVKKEQSASSCGFKLMLNHDLGRFKQQ